MGTNATARDDEAIRRQLERIVTGIRSKDITALAALYSPDVVSFDVEPPLQHVGVAAKLANWERAFAAFADVDYELCDLTVTVGGDVAFGHAFGRLHGTLRNGMVTHGMWVRATFCLVRTEGTWLIAHDQASVPFDIATGRGVTDLVP
ncbi:YybH family protein [Humibacter ginsenosidimutans]|uniref:DUF4440 domain-containing protein n=1 Tax=Humibacter ginsenosidimutans TaxID=2599293 RepID=A0A5B8M243_9MICO|nr:nuclear transport factor 2 family protein [Humibacter ginsenosidimutans]QDZ14838.1 DUF4440 domain-containing protein [Humibacter ginsenosidimutans]